MEIITKEVLSWLFNHGTVVPVQDYNEVLNSEEYVTYIHKGNLYKVEVTELEDNK